MDVIPLSERFVDVAASMMPGFNSSYYGHERYPMPMANLKKYELAEHRRLIVQGKSKPIDTCMQRHEVHGWAF